MTTHRLKRTLLSFALAALVAHSLLHADDTLSFAFPLILAEPPPEELEGGSFSFAYAGQTRRAAAVNRTEGELFALNEPIAGGWYGDTAVDAYRYAFGGSNTLQRFPGGYLMPRTTRGIDITAGLGWHITGAWSVEATATANFADVQESYLYLFNGGVFRNANTQSHDQTYGLSFLYRPSENFSAYFGVALTPVAGSSPYWSPVMVAQWDFDRHWRAQVGFPRTGVWYRFAPQVMVFAGLLTVGNLSNVDTPSNAVVQKFPADYREVDLALTLRCNLGRRWRIDVSAGVPVEQRFSFGR